MQWACVTGAGSGIGRSIALHFVEHGLGVYIVGRRMEKLLETKKLAKNPENIVIIQADIGKEQGRIEVEKAIANRELKFLVQNAGIVGPLQNIRDLPMNQFQNVMTTNVEGPIFLAKRLIPALEAYTKKAGTPSRILHISSGCAHNPTKGWLTYSVSKAAFLMAYKCLALDLEPSILVGSLKPGIVDTEMQDEMRLAPEESFPKVMFFKKLKTEKEKVFDPTKDIKPHLPDFSKLDTPENVAHFTWFVLNDTSIEEYSKEDWDIREKIHASRWIPNN